MSSGASVSSQATRLDPIVTSLGKVGGGGYLRFTDTRANKVFVTLECLYGFVAAKTDALKRIVKP
ncbi:MAG: hypothetical protein NTV46_13350 [Verrucomicrobia bacterium]|nr:hypothetical protein [Verrucomicrobiota bacterium]